MVSALGVWGAILDRSIAEMAAASEGAVDGHLVRRVADVWTNNAQYFVGAAVARPAHRRERLARAGLVWMADFGEVRRGWVLQHAEALGYEMKLPDLTADHPFAADPPEVGSVSGVPCLAAVLLHQAMAEIRTGGSRAASHRLVDPERAPLHATCVALSNCGSGVIAAGSSRFRREAAFVALITDWMKASEEARPWFLRTLGYIAVDGQESPEVQTAAADIARAAS